MFNAENKPKLWVMFHTLNNSSQINLITPTASRWKMIELYVVSRVYNVPVHPLKTAKGEENAHLSQLESIGVCIRAAAAEV